MKPNKLILVMLLLFPSALFAAACPDDNHFSTVPGLIGNLWVLTPDVRDQWELAQSTLFTTNDTHLPQNSSLSVTIEVEPDQPLSLVCYYGEDDFYLTPKNTPSISLPPLLIAPHWNFNGYHWWNKAGEERFSGTFTCETTVGNADQCSW